MLKKIVNDKIEGYQKYGHHTKRGNFDGVWRLPYINSGITKGCGESFKRILPPYDLTTKDAMEHSGYHEYREVFKIRRSAPSGRP